MNQSKKNWKKVITASIPVVVLGIATAFGLTNEAQTALETGITMVVTGAVTVWGVVHGVIQSHDNHKK